MEDRFSPHGVNSLHDRIAPEKFNSLLGIEKEKQPHLY